MKNNNLTYEIIYVVGNTYKRKFITAPDPQTACKRARVKNIIDIDIVEYQVKDDYLLRDF